LGTTALKPACTIEVRKIVDTMSAILTTNRDFSCFLIVFPPFFILAMTPGALLQGYEWKKLDGFVKSRHSGETRSPEPLSLPE